MAVFFLLKDPAADATDAPQPEGLLCKPCDEDKEKDYKVFLLLLFNGAPVE